MCNNNFEGCGWQGNIGTLDEHLDQCVYAKIKCPNKCGTVKVLKKDLTYHLNERCRCRNHKYQDSSKEDFYWYITGLHQDVCERKKVECENKECDCILEHRLVQDHVAQDCDYTEVSCKYALLGCEKKMIRKDFKKHEEDHEGHLSLALKSIVDLNSKVLVLQSQFKGGKLASIKVFDYSYKKRNNIMYISESFFTSPSGYKMELQVYTNGNGKGQELTCQPSFVFLRVPLTHSYHGLFLENLNSSYLTSWRIKIIILCL